MPENIGIGVKTLRQSMAGLMSRQQILKSWFWLRHLPHPYLNKTIDSTPQPTCTSPPAGTMDRPAMLRMEMVTSSS